MSAFIYQEGRFLMASVCLGVGIAFVYDCLRILRRVSPHGIFWISLEDLAFWVFVSISIFCLLYYENDGAFRWFAILGAGLGMAVYKKTVSVFYVKYVSLGLLWVKGVIQKACAFLLRPARRMAKRAGQQAARQGHRAASAGRLLKKRLTVRGRLIRINLCKHWKRAQRSERKWSKER